MRVRELIEMLQALPDAEALVIVQNGESRRWLVATGVVDRRISPCPENPDFVIPGTKPAIEIV